MDRQIQSLREAVSEAAVSEGAGKPDFIHNQWFVKYHLEIVDRIAGELLELYPAADADVVRAMVWMHDYGKIVDFDDQYQKTLTEGPKLLKKLGFNDDFASRVIDAIELLDRKMEVDLHEAPIEVQVIASADAAAHFVGPFFFLWWYENANKPYEELMADNLKKIAKDWDRKMVLPEVRAAFEARVTHQREQGGVFPNRFLT